MPITENELRHARNHLEAAAASLALAEHHLQGAGADDTDTRSAGHLAATTRGLRAMVASRYQQARGAQP